MADMKAFGEAIWVWVKDHGEAIFEYEDSEEIMEIAQRHGLSKRVTYDPEIHGEIDNADPGDEIWYFGD